MPDGSRSFGAPQSDEVARITALYRDNGRFVARVLRRCGINDADLEDAVQETFVVAHRRWADFEQRSSARTWLYAIAVRVASTLRRSQRREAARREHAGRSMHAAFELDPEVELTRAQAATILDGLLDQLDHNKRTVFVLAELEGIKAAEISRILGLNVRTVHSRLRLARQSFESAVKRFHARERGRGDRRRLQAHALAQRAEPQRSPRRARAMAAALLVRLNDSSAPAVAGWQQWMLTAPTKASWWVPLTATLALGSAGLAVTANVVDTSQRGPRESATVVTATPSPPATAARQPDASVDPPPVPSPAPSVPPSQLKQQATPRPAPRAVVESGPTPPAPAPAGFDEELQLIETARVAIRQHDAAAALVAIDEHARRFATGQLVTERMHTKIKALCMAGRPSDARALVAQLDTSGGRSRQARDVLDAACR